MSQLSQWSKKNQSKNQKETTESMIQMSWILVLYMTQYKFKDNRHINSTLMNCISQIEIDAKTA